VKARPDGRKSYMTRERALNSTEISKTHSKTLEEKDKKCKNLDTKIKLPQTDRAKTLSRRVKRCGTNRRRKQRCTLLEWDVEHKKEKEVLTANKN